MSVEIKKISDLFDGEYNATVITDETFEGGNYDSFRVSVFHYVVFRNCTFLHTQFAWNNMCNVRFEHCALIGCCFKDNRFSNVRFSECCPVTGYFSGNMGDCQFVKCRDVSGLDITDNEKCFYDFRGAVDYRGIHLVDKCPPIEDGFIAFKKALFCTGNDDVPSFQATENLIVNASRCVLELYVPPHARRIMCIGSKGRCEKALVKRAYYLNGDEMKPDGMLIASLYDLKFEYKVGKWIIPDYYDDNPIEECSHGIHFFMSFQEAAEY